MHDSERTRPYEGLLCVSRNRYSFEGALMVKTWSRHHTSFEHWPNSAAHIAYWPVTTFCRSCAFTGLLVSFVLVFYVELHAHEATSVIKWTQHA